MLPRPDLLTARHRTTWATLKALEVVSTFLPNTWRTPIAVSLVIVSCVIACIVLLESRLNSVTRLETEVDQLTEVDADFARHIPIDMALWLRIVSVAAIITAMGTATLYVSDFDQRLIVVGVYTMISLWSLDQAAVWLHTANRAKVILRSY